MSKKKSKKSEKIYAIEYMRPDGWWEAGRGWTSKKEAKADAEKQLPANAEWRVVRVKP